MNLGQLKDLIEMCEAEGADDQTEVRLAEQPNWPFEYSISSVKVIETNDEDIADTENALQCETDEATREEMATELERLRETNERVIFILEGSQLRYASKDLWN